MDLKIVEATKRINRIALKMRTFLNKKKKIEPNQSIFYDQFYLSIYSNVIFKYLEKKYPQTVARNHIWSSEAIRFFFSFRK